RGATLVTTITVPTRGDDPPEPPDVPPTDAPVPARGDTAPPGALSSGDTPDPDGPAPPAVLRPHAEQQYAAELAALAASDARERPPAWRLSPWAVCDYLLGGTLADGTVITPKYVGARRLVEVAVATLATDRALLLLGAPGTAKTWMSEHL